MGRGLISCLGLRRICSGTGRWGGIIGNGSFWGRFWSRIMSLWWVFLGRFIWWWTSVILTPQWSWHRGIFPWRFICSQWWNVPFIWTMGLTWSLSSKIFGLSSCLTIFLSIQHCNWFSSCSSAHFPACLSVASAFQVVWYHHPGQTVCLRNRR